MEAGLRQLGRHDAPDQPDRKAEVLGDNRPDEIAFGDSCTFGLPEVLIIWIPFRNPGRVSLAHSEFVLCGGMGFPVVGASRASQRLCQCYAAEKIANRLGCHAKAVCFGGVAA
jgi:hypothetical protein